MQSYRKLIAFSFSCLAAGAFGQVVPQVQQPAAVQYDYCPAPQDLVKDGLYWKAPGGWVSYGESFEDKILHFVRAEWKGINVGKVICIYKGNKLIAFPIALELKQTKIIPSPTGGQWSKDLGGRQECNALHYDVKDCPFVFEKTEKPTDVYKDLDFYKGKSLDY